LTTLTIAELISKLQVQEQRVTMRSEGIVEDAFQARHKFKHQKESRKVWLDKSGEVKSGGNQGDLSIKGKFPPCGICKKTNHLEKNCWQNSKRSPIQCRYCKKYGHIEKYCRQKQNQSGQSSHRVNFADDHQVGKSEEEVFMASHTSHIDQCKWYVDSACTRHMAIDENLFVTLDRSDRTKVKLGNGALVEAHGRGSVKFPTDEGTKIINDVLYVPNLTQNLLSVAQLLHKNYSLNFKDKQCVIYDPKGCEVAKISMIDNSFPISCYSIDTCSFNVELSDTWLWHKRFGHYNLSSLVYMQSKGMVLEVPKIDMCRDVCESCQFGKMHRRSFPKGSLWRAKEKLELVHTDLCGPMRTASLSGNKYFVLFVDDLTRMTWVYFLSSKLNIKCFLFSKNSKLW